MKRTKRESLIALLTAAFLLFAFTACTPQVSPSSSGVETPSGTPEGTNSSSKVAADFWCNLNFIGISHHAMEGTGYSVREIDYSGGELQANFSVINTGVDDGIDALELGLMVFCDGVPTEYTLLDSGKTGFYEILRVEGEEMQTFQLTFTPDFDLGLGRIDLYLVLLPYEISSLLRTHIEIVHAVLPEGYAAQGTYSNVIGNVKDGQIVTMPDSLKNAKSAGTNLLVMEPKKKYIVGSGASRYKIGGKEETWICAYAPAPGKYRLVFLLDGKPLALEDGKTVLNCEFGEDEMFSAIVPLKQMIPPGEHSLMAVATRVDEQSFQTRESCYQLSSLRVGIVN